MKDPIKHGHDAQCYAARAKEALPTVDRLANGRERTCCLDGDGCRDGGCRRGALRRDPLALRAVAPEIAAAENVVVGHGTTERIVCKGPGMTFII